MTFSSPLFLFLFFPAALGIYFGLASAWRQQRTACCAVLTVLSIVFYYWGGGAQLLLLLLSVLFNFLAARFLASSPEPQRRWILAIGIGCNLALLAYYKYAAFALANISSLVGRPLWPNLHPALPVGISFFTFMSIGYLVDVYKREQRPAGLLPYATYLTLFPHLVAGPIVRYGEIERDISSLRRPTADEFLQGIVRFAEGLTMKVVLADNLSLTVDRIFAVKTGLSTSLAWYGALTYSFQIYFDFAGYSAMAIGLALTFGFHFPENFERPYRASSVTEFWRRWHMSLSRFLRDYLYIPLGGSHRGRVRTYANLFIVFTLCGLWHGAAWTFVLWGMYHGILLIAERALGVRPSPSASWIGSARTFLLVTVGWVFFRAESVGTALDFLRAMFTIGSPSTDQIALYADPFSLFILLAAAVCAFFPRPMLARMGSDGWTFRRAGLTVAAVSAMLLLGSVYAVSNTYKPFIYFRF